MVSLLLKKSKKRFKITGIISISSNFPIFLVYHNTIMIYNTRKRSNDTIESQKERKTCFNAHFQYYRLKIAGQNRMRSLKSLAMLKCESRTSLHALQYK